MRFVKTIFLDYDGCLHPSHHEVSERFNRAQLLDECLRPSARNVEIVVSSSWRFNYSPVELQAFLPTSLAKLVTNATGSAVIGRHARWREIQAYVSAYGIKDYKVIDDSRYEFPDSCDALVHCNPSIGIDTEQIKQLEAWLSL
jgi:hypothetical protein